jgi:hypothetical protein
MSHRNRKPNEEFRRPRHPRHGNLDHCSGDRDKVRYRDKKLAINYLHTFQNKAARQLEELGFTNRHECRVYKCETCKGWHTTSQKDWVLGA